MLGLDKLSSDLLNSNLMVDSGRTKQALFEAISVMGKAFASPVRLELLDLLAQAPRSVDELARAIDQTNANTSQHLQALHAAGLVTRQREGTRVRYALAGDEALRVWRPGTSTEPALFPWTSSSAASTSCPPTRRSSPTAGGRSAPMPTMPSAASARPAATPGASMTAGLNGDSLKTRPARTKPRRPEGELCTTPR